MVHRWSPPSRSFGGGRGLSELIGFSLAINHIQFKTRIPYWRRWPDFWFHDGRPFENRLRCHILRFANRIDISPRPVFTLMKTDNWLCNEVEWLWYKGRLLSRHKIINYFLRTCAFFAKLFLPFSRSSSSSVEIYFSFLVVVVFHYNKFNSAYIYNGGTQQDEEEQLLGLFKMDFVLCIRNK